MFNEEFNKVASAAKAKVELLKTNNDWYTFELKILYQI